MIFNFFQNFPESSTLRIMSVWRAIENINTKLPYNDISVTNVEKNVDSNVGFVIMRAM